jgi:hypothetical protein
MKLKTNNFVTYLRQEDWNIFLKVLHSLKNSKISIWNFDEPFMNTNDNIIKLIFDNINNILSWCNIDEFIIIDGLNLNRTYDNKYDVFTQVSYKTFINNLYLISGINQNKPIKIFKDEIKSIELTEIHNKFSNTVLLKINSNK